MKRDTRDITPIGIDFGSRYLKLVQFMRDESRLRPSAIELMNVPINSLLESKQDRANAVQSVRKALAKSGFVGRRAVANLPNELFEYCNFRLAGKDQKDAVGRTQEQAAKQMGLNPDEVYCQFFEPRSGNDGTDEHIEITALAAPSAGLHDYLRFLTACGLTPVAIDVSPGSLVQLLNTLVSCPEDESKLLVSIGDRWTTIVITSGTELRMVRRLPIGLFNVDTKAADTLEIEAGLASQLRTQLLESDSCESSGDVSQYPALKSDDVVKAFRAAADGTVKHICHEMERCIQYFTMTYRCHRPESGVLVGGGATQMGISGTIQRESGVLLPGIEAISTSDAIDLTPPTGEYPPAALWAEAAGLALYHESPAVVRRAA